MTLTEEQIAEIRARAEAATPGSWLFNVPLKKQDLHFIAHARDDIPALLSALEAANKRADEAEARRKCYECGSEMTACARCNPELPTAELTRLREENERYREAARGQVVIVNTASSRIKELEAAVVKLREALKRFAEVAELDIGDDESDSDLFRPMDPRHSVSGNISIGHLRRAHEVMQDTDWVADKIRAQKAQGAAPQGEQP